MIYNEYRKIIENTAETEDLEYGFGVGVLHPEWHPLRVISDNGCTEKIIKVAARSTNFFGKMVPVIRIGDSAFKDNKTVTDIILGSDICSVGAGAFAGCTSLERITIPKGVRCIREGTFAGCTALTDVYYEGTLDEWKAIDTRSEFEPAPMYSKHSRYSGYGGWYGYYGDYINEYEEAMLAYCNCYGVDSSDVELLLEYGYICGEIEAMLADHNLLQEALHDVKYMCGEDIYENCYGGAF